MYVRVRYGNEYFYKEQLIEKSKITELEEIIKKDGFYILELSRISGKKQYPIKLTEEDRKINAIYIRHYSKYYNRCVRGSISKEKLEEWKTKAKILRQKCKSKEITLDEFLEKIEM